MNNVTATNIVVLSGGTNSIILNNVSVTEQLKVQNDDSIRIETKGTTNIAKTLVKSGAILEATAGTFGSIDLAPTSVTPVTLKGNFGSSAIKVSASNTVLEIAPGAQVGTVTVDAEGTTVNNAGTIAEVKANKEVEITGTQPEKLTPGQDVVVSATVSDEAELKAALKNEQIKQIKFKNNIDTHSQILVTQANQEIDGGGFTLFARNDSDGGFKYSQGENKSVLTVLSANNVNISRLTVDAKDINKADKWDGIYTLQVYNSTDVNLTKVSLKNGDGGLLVNGSAVTVTDITTIGNEVGGIEVSKGTAEGLSNSSLTIKGNSVHEDEANKPAVWVYPNQTLNADQYVITAKGQGGDDKNQTYYNLKTALSVYGFVIEDYGQVVEGTTVNVPVSLKAIAENKLGYNAVIAEVSTTVKPENSTVTFYAQDSEEKVIVQTDNGVWGPNNGFALTNNHDATTPFTVTFSAAGNYTIVVKLKDKVTGEYIAEKTVNVNVIASVPSA